MDMPNALKIKSTMMVAAPLADGVYTGTISGYRFTTNIGPATIVLELSGPGTGIRGTSPATLTIANGIPSIKTGR
jgi:hypothetical protein